MVAEFSLDREDSALSRLVLRVERAQNQINREFSLDQEQSALARIRRELLAVVEGQRDASEKFQREVLEKLAAISARRQESARSTRHGEDFESEVFDFVQTRSQRAGDVASRVGNTTGVIKNCKVGDAIIALGPDHAAAGARIVVEAKARAGFGLVDAISLMDTARKNRQAEVGIFVFSSRLAPDGIEPLARYGSDVVVVWNTDDANSDIVLCAGLSVASALCTRARLKRDAEAVDFASIDAAIREIERQLAGLDEITKLTEHYPDKQRESDQARLADSRGSGRSNRNAGPSHPGPSGIVCRRRTMTLNAADTSEHEFRVRAAVLADALSQLPSDALTLAVLFDLAVSATIAVTLDPSVARLLFEARVSGSTSRDWALLPIGCACATEVPRMRAVYL